MLSHHITPGIRFHVYTEADRPVPAPMIKHALTNWSISGPKQSWWYKMQLFNPAHHAGPLLYFDLDTVIVRNIDWIWQQPLRYLWAVRDFKYLWRPHDYQINSSIMWWDTRRFESAWQALQCQTLKKVMSENRGDQDYLARVISANDFRLFDPERVKSWRWQSLDGGYDFSKKCYKKPSTGTQIDHHTSVMIFHGRPKPSDITDPVILQYWK
jgi:hypothetical protein